MPAARYLGIDGSGNTSEVPAIATSAGAGDAFKVVCANASGLIDPTLLPTSGLVNLTAYEGIAAGAMIALYNDGGTVKARNASDSGMSLKADGFAPTAVLIGATGAFNLGNGANTGVTGLTIGASYFLGVAGAVTVTAPTTATKIRQKLGVARTATELEVVLGEPIIRA